MGSTIIPASLLFTLRTISACCSAGWFLWMTVIPPSRAKAIARDVSDTVSMAALSRGMFSSTSFVTRVATLTSLGSADDSAGTSNTSSKDSAFLVNFRSQSINVEPQDGLQDSSGKAWCMHLRIRTIVVKLSSSAENLTLCPGKRIGERGLFSVRRPDGGDSGSYSLGRITGHIRIHGR